MSLATPLGDPWLVPHDFLLELWGYNNSYPLLPIWVSLSYMSLRSAGDKYGAHLLSKSGTPCRQQIQVSRGQVPDQLWSCTYSQRRVKRVWADGCWHSCKATPWHQASMATHLVQRQPRCPTRWEQADTIHAFHTSCGILYGTPNDTRYLPWGSWAVLQTHTSIHCASAAWYVIPYWPKSHLSCPWHIQLSSGLLP